MKAAMIISGVLVTIVFADRIDDVEDISIYGIGGGELRGCRKMRGFVVVGLKINPSGVLTREATSVVLPKAPMKLSPPLSSASSTRLPLATSETVDERHRNQTLRWLPQRFLKLSRRWHHLQTSNKATKPFSKISASLLLPTPSPKT
jgi:hypothetical protein